MASAQGNDRYDHNQCFSLEKFETGALYVGLTIRTWGCCKHLRVRVVDSYWVSSHFLTGNHEGYQP